MECPKCGGGTFLSEEELIKIIEEPRKSTKAVIRATYQCRACSEKFTRLQMDDLEKRGGPKSTPINYQQQYQRQETSETEAVPESLKFF